MDLATAPTRPDLPPFNIVFRPNPNFGPKGSGEMLVSARTDYEDTKAWTRTRWGVWHDPSVAPVQVDGGSFDEAVAAAREIVRAERKDTRWGLFRRLQGRVDAVAVLEAAKGWQLVRVDTPLDDYMEPVPGAMAPWQKWRVDPMSSVFRLGDVRRERTDVVALVGENESFDLRGTKPSDPTEPA